MTFPYRYAVKKEKRVRPKEYPSLVSVVRFYRAHLAEHGEPYEQFNAWKPFVAVEDKVNMADYLEWLYLVRFSNEDVESVTTPEQLINRLQQRYQEPPREH